MASGSVSVCASSDMRCEELGMERTMTTSSSISNEEPYVHSETAVCIRDSEGSFSERRGRLDSALRNSLKVSKTDLLQRNIFQGVNVVRRGSRQLEEKLSARPPLEEMISKRRLTADYVDKVFPDRLEDSIAPSAERIERVSLHRLLAPPAKKQGSISTPSAASSSSPQAPQGAPLDPAMLAAMVVQAAMMSKSNDPRPPTAMPTGIPQAAAQTMPGQPGQMWPGQVGQARRSPPYDMTTWPKMVAPYLLRPDVTAPSPAIGSEKGATQSSTNLAEGHSQPLNMSAFGSPPKVSKPKQEASFGATSSSAIGSQGTSLKIPKPPIQVSRMDSERSQKPAFVRLLDDFCERTLNKDVSSNSAPVPVAPPAS